MNKKNNKGFSLVELIVVVAIMAVLVGVLAPSLLRYVEKTRIQKDVSAIDEVMSACEIAMADETVNTKVSTSGQTIDLPGATKTTLTAATTAGKELENEVAKTIKEVNLTSNGLKGVTISVTAKVGSTGVVEVTAAVKTGTPSDDAAAALKQIGIGATTTTAN